MFHVNLNRSLKKSCNEPRPTHALDLSTMVWLSLHTNLILNISCDKRWGPRAGRELCPSHFLEMWTAPPLHTPMYYIPLVPVTLWIMLILCCEGCLALPLTNPWVLEGPLWSLRTWPLLTQVWQGCRCPHSSPLTPGAPPWCPVSTGFQTKDTGEINNTKGMWPSGLWLIFLISTKP